MRFLLDEDAKKAVVPLLSKTGHDVERVVDVESLGPGSDDVEVMEYATATNRIIVTHDDDFVDPDVENQHEGVFFFPSQRHSPYEMFQIVEAAAGAYPDRDAMSSVLYLTSDWL